MSTLVAGRPVVTTVLSSWPKTVRRWLERANVETLFIAKASPWENGYIESFNGKLREELLNRELFLSLEEARWVLDRWRLEYNHVRLHSAIGYVAPADKLNGLEAVIFAEWDRKARRGARTPQASPSGGENGCVMIAGALQTKTTWAEDRAMLRSNPSADPGAKIEERAVFFPKDAAHLPLRDWRQSDKPSRPDAAILRQDAAHPLANHTRLEFQFTVNQDKAMSDHVLLLSIPNLRAKDLQHMPRLGALTRRGSQAALAPSFPAVTCPVQANMTTGLPPSQHGVVANGFYWRAKRQVEMWTAWNECIERPQIWDLLHERDPKVTSAVWFPLHSKGCGADFICTPAPIHNPDGSESLWCYTRPEPLYGELRDALGHFPLQHFWGPMANIQSSKWIADSAVIGAKRFRPNFFSVYLPHLDYAAQKHGPDSPAALSAVGELDEVIGRLAGGVHDALGADNEENIVWLVASEYTIRPVDHVLYPNRLLREAGLLAVREEEDGEHLDLASSAAWALVDHQFSHVFVREGNAETIRRVVDLFRGRQGVAEALAGGDLARYGLDHARSGEVVLVSTPNSWQAYYWWLDESQAPAFAHTVDIHRKPGYDPVELHFDPAHKRVPLDAGLVRGSHGAPEAAETAEGALLCSQPGVLRQGQYRDLDVAGLVLDQFSS